jgi:hypothetical protein
MELAAIRTDIRPTHVVDKEEDEIPRIGRKYRWQK